MTGDQLVLPLDVAPPVRLFPHCRHCAWGHRHHPDDAPGHETSCAPGCVEGRERTVVAMTTETPEPQPTETVPVEEPAKTETEVEVPADSDLADAGAPEPFTVESKEAPRA